MTGFRIHKIFTQSGNTLAVCIPIEYARQLELEDGSYVRITIGKNKLVLQPINGSEPTLSPEVVIPKGA